MAKQETQIAILEEQQRMNTQEHTEIKESLKEIKDAITNLDTRFSAKWVEKGITVIISAIVLGVIYEIFRRAGVPIK